MINPTPAFTIDFLYLCKPLIFQFLRIRCRVCTAVRQTVRTPTTATTNFCCRLVLLPFFVHHIDIKMFSVYFVAMMSALCVLLIAPEAAAFVGSNAFMGRTSSITNRATAVRAGAAAARSSTGAVLTMSEDSEEAPAGPTALEISQGIAHPAAVFTVPENIMKVLPHRYPFALVDKVLHFEPGKRIVGVKCISNNEPQFTGHFPDLPIMPGVLQVRLVLYLVCKITMRVYHFKRTSTILSSRKYEYFFVYIRKGDFNCTAM